MFIWNAVGKRGIKNDMGVFLVLPWLLSILTSGAYTIYDILTTGAYKNWSIGDWLWNIAYLLLMWQSFLRCLCGLAKTVVAIAGGLGRLLMKVPLLGTLVSLVHSIYLGFKTVGSLGTSFVR